MSKDNVSRYDFRPLEKPVKTDSGFLRTPVFATRSGVFKYIKPDGTVIREYRPPEEVFRPDSMMSLAGVPVTNRHPAELVDSRNAKDHMVGFTGDNIEKDGNFVKTMATVTDHDMIDQVEKGGLREVSCGYTCDLEFVSGRTDAGEEYDAIQKNIVYNHLAIVERGRAGPEVRLRMDSNSAILDDDQNKEPFNNGDANSKKGDAMAKTKIKLNGSEFEVDGDVANAMTAALKDARSEGEKKAMDTFKKQKKDEADAEIEKMTAKIDALETENKELKEKKVDSKQVHEMVIARGALVETAKKVLDSETKFDEMTDSEIKKAVVEKQCPDLKLDEKSDVYIEARFDHIAEGLEKTDADKNDKLKAALGNKAGREDSEEIDSEKTRTNNMKADSEAWTKPLGFSLNQ